MTEPSSNPADHDEGLANPGMTGTPPSQRPKWHDPAMHALDFSRRYREDLDIATGQIMLDLGLDPKKEIGAKDPDYGFEYATFHPNEQTVGGVSPDGRITIDSGIMNPEAMDAPYGEEAGNYWRRMRLPDRIKAIVAHEYEEHQGGDHEASLKNAPDTKLSVGEEVREMLRKMERGWHR